MATNPLHGALTDIVEDSPAISRATSQPTLTNVDNSENHESNAKDYHISHPSHEHQSPPISSPGLEHARRNSSVSHVGVDFFDQEGVQQLGRTMAKEQAAHGKKSTESTSSSDRTLPGSEEPFDFEKTIREEIRKRDDANIKPRTLGVAFKDLTVVGRAPSNSWIPTIGSLFNPMVIMENIQGSRHPTLRNIITGFEGVVKPGEMLLVLGNPGSGCSTFLKTIANQRQEYHSVDGAVHYDSIEPNELRQHFRGDVQYCPEDDVHFATLSVAQTINFAARARTPRTRVGETRKQFADKATDMLATLFGLRHALGTPVGDAAIRGVSGGEKKRVSITEALASRACIGTWDNSTRGLDSSTALEFVRALRIATDTFEQTTVVTLYQAGESLYTYFDKVCVIYEGRMVYYGSADKAKQYFLDMGYEPANRQTTPDFLVAITDPLGRIPRAGFTNQPRTAAEFAEYFKKSEIGHANSVEYEEYCQQYVGKPERRIAYIESARAEFAKRSRKSTAYLLSIPQQVSIVMKRRSQIIAGNPAATILTFSSYVLQAIIVGSVFLKSPETTGAFFSRGGALFFSILFPSLTSMAEIPTLYAQRPIIYRQDKSGFYHPFVEALAFTLVDVPFTAATSILFSLIVYFMIGFQKSAEQYLIFLLFIFIVTLTMKAWFRALTAAFTAEATAQSVGGISVLALVIYTGYTVPKPSMIGALKWLTFINPLKYGFESILTNEFRTLKGECSNLVPEGVGYEGVTLVNQVCTTVGAVPGQSFVDGARFAKLAYGFSFSHTWMNLGIDIAFGIAFISAYLWFTEYNTSSIIDTPVTLFKRVTGARSLVAKSGSGDEEKVASSEKPGASTQVSSSPSAAPSVAGVLRHTDVFSWKDINYDVPISGKPDRRLLSNVSGYVAPGKLTALMGESGAGKTTLLNVLAMRTSTGVVTGDRFVNGQALPADFQSQSGYCQQMDTHVPTSTVREALLFSAKLRQPPSVPIAEKEAYVEQCLKMCGLEAYANASVGSLNVEYKKRTTIAVELAAKPKLLLFLDEPTSGLDSKSAWAIMSFLRALADSGQAILCTIHQPSAELFQVFDRMLLLRKGGQTVYAGDIGHNATTLIKYFERNGARTCLPHENPAEYMLDVIGAGATATSDIDWHRIWNASSEAKTLQAELDDIHTEGRSRPAVTTEIHSEFATGWTFQLWELLKRASNDHYRNPDYLIAKLVLNGVGGLFIGFTFFKSKDTQQATQNKLFAIFMATILSVPLSNQLQVPFINMRSIYEIRERPSRMYSWTSMITAQMLIEVPWNFLGSLILFFSWYWTVGFETARAGYTFIILVIAFPLYYSTFSLAVAATAPNAEIAGVIFSFMFSFVLTFNGVLQPYAALGWWKWMYRLSPYTYLIEGILGQAIGRQEVNCSSVEFVTINPPSGQTCAQYMGPYIARTGGYLANPESLAECAFCSIRSTDQFLGNNFNILYEHHWRNLGIFFAFIVFNIFLFFSCMYLFRIRTGSLLPSFRRRRS
ncbi:hypothetical protein D9619_009293 [Psilocybe cf. subviscida]|uniref:ABC transporter domain-containing protein n=1 Tax=Psilocybe cf. subviscida TaxID=2480587 RepID=A0A8H5BW59_9AGAR|nr:hypothetical protein D9619_009293 [Psilocybe cf. subviscida]